MFFLFTFACFKSNLNGIFREQSYLIGGKEANCFNSLFWGGKVEVYFWFLIHFICNKLALLFIPILLKIVLHSFWQKFCCLVYFIFAFSILKRDYIHICSKILSLLCFVLWVPMVSTLLSFYIATVLFYK